jgi:sec-independent protein translocase protein TatB
MFNVGSGEMLVIFLLALLVLGPERLPKAMGQVGRAVAQMRKLSSGFQDEIRRAMDPIEAPFRPGEQTLHGPVPSITDEVRVVNAEPEPAVTLDKASEPVDLPDADDDVAVEPTTGALVVDDGDEGDDAAGPRGTVTPLRPRPAEGETHGDGDGGDGDRATG